MGGKLDQRTNRSFELLSEGRRLIFSEVLSKHYFPPHQLPGRCKQHATALLDIHPYSTYEEGPCGLRLVWPGPISWADSIGDCAARCGAKSDTPALDDMSWLHIHRDPHASALSACIWYEPLAARSEAVLDACVRVMFPRDVAWLKYREAWLTSNRHLRERTTLVSYEELLRAPRQSLQKVGRSFLRVQLDENETDAMLSQLTPEALNRADGRYDMHDSWDCKSGARPAALARAIAAAGGQPSSCHRVKVQTHLGRPAVSNATRRWMDDILQSMRFSSLAPPG